MEENSDGAVINDILLSAFEQVEEVAEALKIEVDTERDLWVLMEKANRALGHIPEEISKLSSLPTPEPLPSFETKESLRLEKALSRMTP